MSKTLWQTMLVLLALFLILPAAASAQQEKPSGSHPSDSRNSKAVKAPDNLPLQSLTLVSTDDAARKAAEEARAKKQPHNKAASETAKPEGDKATANAAVIEFHPTEGTAANSSKGTFQVKDRKKSALKNIHGSAYGAAASGIGAANGEGGAVGADSGSGKFNVYVEGEHAHDNTPNPH
jgi:hypothetical protein